MAEASRIVLRGFELIVKEKVIRYPDRYMDEDGEKMWNVVMELLEQEMAAKAQNVAVMV